jgi:hypothetical protein
MSRTLQTNIYSAFLWLYTKQKPNQLRYDKISAAFPNGGVV